MARMHDKYLIVDNEAYIVGGRNTFGYFLGSYEGIKNYDRDVLVYNTGAKDSSIYELQNYYGKISNLSCCSLFHQDEVLQTEKNVKEKSVELAKRFENVKKKYPQWTSNKYNFEKMTVPCNKVTLITNPVENEPKEPVAFYKLMKLCQGAKKNVVIHSPYVICNDYMTKELQKIGTKGIIMLNSAQNNGNLFGFVDYIQNKQKLIDTNLEIHEYEGENSYHGKSITIDDDMSIIGSFNMDMRSAYIDTEIMLAIHSKDVYTQLSTFMQHYDENAAIVETIDTYRDTPQGKKMKPLSSTKKIISGAFGWLFNSLRYLM
jgi:phosphatidylserine/phosphatidylglycerophosphate/cardiolipin synthase-like enzyme